MTRTPQPTMRLSAPWHRRLDPVFLALAVAWTVLILLINGSPASQLPDVSALHIENIDKAAHFTFYCMMAVLYWNAFVPSEGHRPLIQRPRLLAFGIPFLIGIVDELHQIPVPGRSCDWHDLVADACGALSVVLIATYRKRKG